MGVWLTLGWARAHDFQITSVAAVFDGRGGYQLDMAADVDALALGLDPATDSAVVAARMEALTPAQLDEAADRARATLRQWVRLEFDGTPAEAAIEFPHRGTPAATTAEIPTVLGTLVRFRGRTPEGARELTFRADPAFKVVDLKIFHPEAAGPEEYTLRPGEQSPPFALGQQEQVRQGVFGQYLLLGFEHILPKGLDHILFVLGLFLLSVELKPLLWQVTAFTVAHSVTLALSMLDVVSLPSRPVETLIAVSIAYVGIENVLTSRLHAWRTALVFVFGLLHGLGFAGVLHELGAPTDRFFPALIGFNLGVELGQVTVLALAFLAVGRFRRERWYRKAVVVPASLGIAAVALYWAWERALG
ncbi:MAG: HupE/UreJ family protein [Acidobacteria bacterium]|nr:HupE/UreJ family protein [Acidobacteriota bacterium]